MQGHYSLLISLNATTLTIKYWNYIYLKYTLHGIQSQNKIYLLPLMRHLDNISHSTKANEYTSQLSKDVSDNSIVSLRISGGI